MQRNVSHKRSSPFSVLWRIARRGILALLLLLLTAAVLLYWFQDRIGQRICNAAEAAIDQHLSGSGWTVDIGGVQWNGNGSVSIRQVGFFANQSAKPAITIGPVELLKQDLRELVDLNFTPDRIVFPNTELRYDLSHCTPEELRTLAQALKPKRPPERLPSISGQGCRLVLVNSETGNASSQLMYDVDFSTTVTLDEYGQRTLVARGTSSSSKFESGQFIVATWPDQKVITGKLEARGLTLRENDLAWLPAEIQNAIPDLTVLQVRSDLQIEFSHALDSAAPLHWSATGQVYDLSIHGAGVPLSVSRGEFDFTATVNQIDISNTRAHLGNSLLQGDFSLGLLAVPGQSGLTRYPWKVLGRIDDLEVGTLSQAQLPADLAKLVSQFSPQGICDLSFDCGWDGQQLTRNINANIQAMSFTFHKFPYLLENCVGTATWKDDLSRFSIQSLENGQIIEIDGWIQSPGPNALFEINFVCNGELPIDEKLFRAMDLYPQIARQVRDIRPRGAFGANGRFVRKTVTAIPLLEYSLDLKHGQARHVKFEYPVREITGRVNVRGRDIEFQNMRGMNGSSQFQWSGQFKPESGFQMIVIADELVLDNQVRAALPAGAGAAWDQIRPAGTMKLVRVDLAVPPEAGAAMKLGVRADAQAPQNPGDSGLSIKPSAFPWQLDRISAHMELDDHSFSITNLRGEHGRAWFNSNVSGSYNSDSWQFALQKFTAGSVAVNDELKSAMPGALAGALDDIRFDGVVQVSGDISFFNHPAVFDPSRQSAGPGNTSGLVSRSRQGVFPHTLESDWNLRIDLNNASADFGLPVRNISGMLQLAGRDVNGNSLSTGQLNLEAASVYDAWITHLTGPVRFDNHRAEVGMFAHSTADPPGQPAQSLTGELFGGEFNLDARCWDEDGGKYYVQSTLYNGHLARAVGCLDESVCETGGVASCAVRCGGDLRSTESIVGEGILKLSDARLYELPVMMDVLGAMRTGNAKRSAFDSGTVDFGLRGDQIDLNRIELNGDALSLIGNGTMDWRHRVDLNFYTVMGRNRLYIPILSELYQASSQQILWVVVNGTLDSPIIEQKVLPGINEGLRILLEPAERTARMQ